MSQEQPPIRSRRELRQARDERLEANQEAGTPGPGAVPPASNDPASKNAASKNPAAGTPRPAGVVDPGEPTEAEITGRRRIAGPRGLGPQHRRLRAVLAGPCPGPRHPAHHQGTCRKRRQPRRRRTAHPAPAPAAAAGGRNGPGNLRQPDCPRLPADPGHPDRSPARRRSSAAALPCRTRRVRSPPSSAPPLTGANAPGRSPTAATAGRGGQGPEGMTVEQALAARELLAQQAQNQLAKMEHINATDPDAVDPDVLAEQIALAERAAVLNRRAAAKQKLAEQNSKPEPVRNDPDHGQQPGHGHPPGVRPGPRRGAARLEAPCHVLRSSRHQPGSPG